MEVMTVQAVAGLEDTCLSTASSAADSVEETERATEVFMQRFDSFLNNMINRGILARATAELAWEMREKGENADEEDEDEDQNIQFSDDEEKDTLLWRSETKQGHVCKLWRRKYGCLLCTSKRKQCCNPVGVLT